MGTREIPQAHAMMLNGQSEDNTTGWVIEEYVASAAQDLLSILIYH